jgi:hypothetical protein
MSEIDSYLSQIFGPGALCIDTYKNDELISGVFDWGKGVSPLKDIVQEGDSLSLTVTEAHTSGHFSEVSTLPAYEYKRSFKCRVYEDR